MELLDDTSAVFELAPVAMWVCDARAVVRKVNPEALRLLGVAQHECVGERLVSFCFQADRDALAGAGLFTHPSAAVHVMCRLHGAGGTLKPVTLSARALSNSGTAEFLVVASTDLNQKALQRAHLRASQALSETLASVSDGFFEMDRECRIIMVNGRAAEIWGRPESSVLGLKFRDAFPEAVGTIFQWAYEVTLRDQCSQHFEAYYAPTKQWLVVHALPSESGLAVYFSDITEQRQAADNLKRSHEQFELVARATNDVIWDWDLKSNQLWWSPALKSAFGVDPDTLDANDNRWSQHVHAEDREAVLASIQQALASDAISWTGEYRFARADGRYATVLDRGLIVRTDGVATRMVGAMQDISVARAFESELRVYESVVNSAPNGIVLVDARDPELPLVFVNPAFESITGYRSAEVLGRNCRFLQGRDTDVETIALLGHAIREQRQETVVVRNYRKDGSMFWNQLIIAPVRTSTGQLSQYVGIITDVTQQRYSEDALVFHTTHDVLTGLLNRQMIEDRLAQAVIQAHRHASVVAVLALGLDDFKILNDSLGHGAGDEILRHVADRLRSHVHAGDSVARTIGDQFMIVLTSLMAADDLKARLERLLAEFAAPVRLGEHSVTVGVSVGVALTGQGEDQPTSLIRQANAAMLEAKETARGRYLLHQPVMDRRVAERLSLESDLRCALSLQQFELHYQLQTNAHTGAVHGAEALIRWRRTADTLSSPQEFMPVAEASGLIVPIGQWVLKEACRQAKAWHQAGMDQFTISVNVSVAQFLCADFIEHVRAALQESALAPECLEIEITETLAMTGIETFIDTLARLKQLGLRIALDDFGTGFSSLSHLRRFAVDTLKIDRSFVRDITCDAKDAAICRSIITMAHNLGMLAIAEGVETEAQASYLARNGCDRLQGFLLHRPAPAALLVARLGMPEPFFHVAIDHGAHALAVLIVDDDEEVAAALGYLLARNHYQPVITLNTTDAFETLALRRIDVVIADERMPDMRGSDFLYVVKNLYPKTVRILQSGFADAEVIAEALNRAQIFRYLKKGAAEADVMLAIDAAFEQSARDGPLRPGQERRRSAPSP